MITEDESKIIISFLFNKIGRTKINPSDLILILSMDLKWFSINKAKDFIRYADDKKLLIKNNNFIEPNFDWKKIEIPFGFKPHPEFYKAKVKNGNNQELINELLNIIKVNKPKENEKILDDIKEICSEKNITMEVAALIYCKKNNINIEEFVEIVKNNLLLEII